MVLEGGKKREQMGVIKRKNGREQTAKKENTERGKEQERGDGNQKKGMTEINREKWAAEKKSGRGWRDERLSVDSFSN